MIIKSITLKHFKCFKDFEYSFNKITHIQGVNGKGKSTITQAAVFALYGYYPELLADIPTKGVSKSCSVGLVIEENGVIYRIVRHYPLKVEVYVNEVKQDLSTAEANDFINNTFGDRMFFSRFRFLDILTKETDFLSEGQVALKKIIFAGMDDTFNTVRKNLTELKATREMFNKDKLVGFKCYPSEKRKELLSSAYHKLNDDYQSLDSEYRTLEMSILGNVKALSSSKTKLNDITKQLEALNKVEKCYTCRQELPKPKYEELLQTRMAMRKQLEEDIASFTQSIDIEEDIKGQFARDREEARTKRERIRLLLAKLENRMKQTQYIYTEKDVLVIKKAIEELDKLSSLYLYETVKSLEPIINSVIDKIGLSLTFDVDTKGKFNILLNKEGQQYKYKELSTGQKLLVQTAFKIAMLLQQNKNGLIVCDEGFGALDDLNLAHVVELFKSLPLQLIFIAQRSQMNDNEVTVLQL